MPEYLSPGVYIEEVDAGPKPIEGVSTSTAGAVGVTVRGPTSGKPELVTSFAEFVRKFGGFLPLPAGALRTLWETNQEEGGRWWQFPLTVKGFFDNGGQRIYIKRVFASTAVSASAVLQRGLVAQVERDVSPGANPPIITVGHLFGIQVGTNVTLRNGETGQPIGAGPFQVTRYDGGTRRIWLNSALPANAGLQAGRRDAVVIQAPQPAAGPAGLTVSAKARGDWGNDLFVRVAPTAGATLTTLHDPTAPGAASRASVASVAGNVVIVEAAPPALTDFQDGDVVSAAGAQAPIQNLDVAGNSFEIAEADLPAGTNWPAGTPIQVDGNPALQAVVATFTAAAGQPFAITVQPSATLNGFASGDHVLINGREHAIGNVNAAANTFSIPALPAGVTWAPGTAIVRLRLANQGAVNQIRLWGAGQLYDEAVLEFDNGTAKEVVQVAPGGVTGDVVTLGGNINNTYFEGNKVRVVELELRAQYRPGGVVEADETFSNLRLVGNPGDATYLTTRINQDSRLIDVTGPIGQPVTPLTDLPIAAASLDSPWMQLGNGADNMEGLTVDDFAGVDGGSGNRTGIASLEDIDEISICAVPGIWSRTVHNALIQHCEMLKDRFAILDPRSPLDIEGIRSFREVYDTKYAALYYPWIEVRDPSTRQNVEVGPSAHMAGLYARVDNERGVHKAPGNEVIRGITRIAQDVTKREQDMLNPRNINVLRSFPGRGNRVWGARVLTSDASWKYINVRRIFIYVEESIDEGTQWVVFEPNDEPTWARVRQSVANFLTTVWRSGALQGAKAEEAFFVRCDRTTMSQDDIDNGRLICVIGIAPVKPAEFVIFRIQQKTLDQQGQP